MRHLFILSFLLALFDGQASASNPNTEARAIFAPVLDYEAAQRNGSPLCLRASTIGTPFEAARDQIGRPSKATQEQVNRYPTFEWRQPITGSEWPLLEPSEAELLNAAVRRLVRQSGPTAMIALDAAASPIPIREAPIEECWHLWLTVPEIDGDLAFVETGFVCGSLCGSGRLYALRQQGGRWQIIGISQSWIS